MTFILDSLRQNIGVCGDAGEQDHLGQLVEEFNGASRQLCKAPDGSSVDVLGTVNAHTEDLVFRLRKRGEP